MRKLLIIAMGFVIVIVAATDALAKRKHVRIYKPSPPVYPAHPIQYPLAAAVPLAVGFDLARRTSCDPRIAVSTGPGDPGFDPAGPKTGNWLVPAIYRSECQGARPKWYGW